MRQYPNRLVCLLTAGLMAPPASAGHDFRTPRFDRLESPAGSTASQAMLCQALMPRIAGSVFLGGTGQKSPHQPVHEMLASNRTGGAGGEMGSDDEQATLRARHSPARMAEVTQMLQDAITAAVGVPPTSVTVLLEGLDYATIHRAFGRRFNLSNKAYLSLFKILWDRDPVAAVRSLATGPLAELNRQGRIIRRSLPPSIRDELGNEWNIHRIHRAKRTGRRVELAWFPDLQRWLPVRVPGSEDRYVRCIFSERRQNILSVGIAAGSQRPDLQATMKDRQGIWIYGVNSQSGHLRVSGTDYNFDERYDELYAMLAVRGAVPDTMHFQGDQKPERLLMAVTYDASGTRTIHESHRRWTSKELERLGREKGAFCIEPLTAATPEPGDEDDGIPEGRAVIGAGSRKVEGSAHPMRYRFQLDLAYAGLEGGVLFNEWGIPVFLKVDGRAPATPEIRDYLRRMEIRDRNHRLIEIEDTSRTFFGLEDVRRALRSAQSLEPEPGLVVMTDVAVSRRNSPLYQCAVGPRTAYVSAQLLEDLIHSGRPVWGEAVFDPKRSLKNPRLVELRFGYYVETGTAWMPRRNFEPVISMSMKLRGKSYIVKAHRRLKIGEGGTLEELGDAPQPKSLPGRVQRSG